VAAGSLPPDPLRPAHHRQPTPSQAPRSMRARLPQCSAAPLRPGAGRTAASSLLKGQHHTPKRSAPAAAFTKLQHSLGGHPRSWSHQNWEDTHKMGGRRARPHP
jgi:hypothetical protein